MSRGEDALMKRCGASNRRSTYMPSEQKMLLSRQAEAAAAKARTMMAAKHFMLTDLDLGFCLWVGRKDGFERLTATWQVRIEDNEWIG